MRLSKYFAITVLSIAAMVLAGWIWDIDFLKRPVPNLVAMNPVSAVAFLFTGFSFLLLSNVKKSWNRLVVGYLLAGAVTSIGVLRMLGVGIDQILFPQKLINDISGNVSNHMAVITAFCFFTLGISLFVLNVETRKKRMPVQYIVLIVALIGLLSIIGYIYRVTTFYNALVYIPMAVHTAFCFLFISLAILFTNPDKGVMKDFTSTFTGGVTARSLIPYAILVPIALGFLRLYGHWAGVFTVEFGAAILVLSIIIVFITIVWYNAVLLNKRDFFRRKTEDELLASEERFRLLVNNVKDYAIFMINPNGIVVSWNEGARYIKGYSADEIVGKHISTFYTEEEVAKGEPAYNLEMAKKNVHFEKVGWRKRKDGSLFWADIVFTAIYDDKNNLQGFVKITRDITDKKKADEKFKSLLEAAPDAMIIANEKGEIVLINQQTEAIFGYKRDEIVGKKVETLIPSDFHNKHQEHRTHYFKNPKVRSMGIGLELFAVRKDGTKFPVEISLSPIETEEGTLVSASVRDITERKKAEQKFRSLLEAAPDAMIIANEKGEIVLINHQTEEIFGYKRDEIIGKKVEILIPSDFHNKHQEHRSHYFKNPKVRLMGIGLELFAVRKDGTKFPVEISLSPIETEEGTLVSASVRDITERKKAEQKFRGLLEAAPDAMIIANEKGEIVLINHQTETIFGYRKDEIIGQKVEILIPADFHNKHREHRHNYFADPKVRSMGTGLELFAVRKDGTRFAVEISLSPLVTEEGTLVSASVRDITERKKVEKQIAYLANLVEQSSDAIVSLDWDNSIKSWNRGAETLYGYRRGEVIGKNFRKIARSQVTEQQLEIIRKELDEKKNWKGEAIHLKANGDPICCLISVTVIQDQNETKGGFVFTARDITERKKLEEQLQKFNEELEEKVRLKTEELTNVFERVSDGFMAFDKDGQITYLNKKMAELNNRTVDDMLGKNFWAEYPQSLATVFHENFQKSIEAQQNMHFEMYSPSLDKWVENFMYPSADGLSLFFRDISDKIKSEAALKHSEDLRRLIMNSSLDAIVCIDKKGSITLWNQQAEKIFGWKEQEILGKRLDETIIPVHYREAHKRGFQHYLQTGEGPVLNKVIELAALNKTGMKFPIELAIVPIKQGKDEIFCAFIRDITERKKSEEQLSQERTLLRTLIDNLPDYIYVKDLELRHLINNAANIKLIGASSEEETLGKTVYDYFKPELANLYMKDDREILRNNMPIINREEPIFTNSGSQRWLLTTKLPLKDRNNNIVGLVGISRDITERKIAEEQIIKEKELSDSAINSLPGIFYLFDSNGKFLRWNKNFETVSGYTAEEINTMTPIDFFDGVEKAYIMNRIEKAFAEGSSDAEANFVTKKNEKIPYYFTGQAILYEDNACLIGTGIDISLRKKVERDLRSSERTYKLLFERNPMPMWILAGDHSFIDVNESALKHYGYSREEFLALDGKQIRPEEDQKRYLEESKKHIPGISNRGIWRHKKKDGSIMNVEIYANDYIYEDKNVRLVLSNDITEKIKAEESLKHSFKEIRQLASHLQDVREEERAGMAREIHDELGQQLTGLKMDISWISKKINPHEDAQVKQKLKGTLELLDETIKTVRKIATDLRPSILDDLGLIAAIEWHSQEFEKRTGVAIKFESDMTDFNFSPAISIGLFRICQESLTNVARHAAAKNILITLKQKDNQIQLAIKDDGKGFDVNKIGHKKTLGLLGMKERTLMMGGKYEFESVQGVGTTLFVRIPFQFLKVNT